MGAMTHVASARLLTSADHKQKLLQGASVGSRVSRRHPVVRRNACRMDPSGVRSWPEKLRAIVRHFQEHSRNKLTSFKLAVREPLTSLNKVYEHALARRAIW